MGLRRAIIVRAGSLAFILLAAAMVAGAQVVTSTPNIPAPIGRYIDQVNGMTADDAVRRALADNGELVALRHEVTAANAQIKQARLRANPTLDIGAAQQVGGVDNSQMVEGTLPLELGGRRSARIRVAEREAAVRQKAVEERERTLASEVRSKFGEALATTLKGRFAEDAVAAAREQLRLIQARVAEGQTAPLEEHMATAEVNRLRAMSETLSGKTDIAFLELLNLLGMSPGEPIRLRGDFQNMVVPLPLIADAVADAVRDRPDLGGLRAMEELAVAEIAQAKAGGKPDASVRTGYQRTRSTFPLYGLTDNGTLRPIDDVFQFFTFGVTLQLPVLNRSQGEVEAAMAYRDAARSRREFGELIVKREVAAAFARYESAARALEIFRVGVREQTGAHLAVIQQMYELGSRHLIEYLAEQRRYIEIENEYIDMQLGVYQARVEIMRATSAQELIGR